MEVTRENFQEVLEELDEVLEKSTFLGIDGEFTGLNSGPEAKAFDTPEQYYLKLRTGSMDFLLVQFGLSVFTWDSETRKYNQRSYNFYVFPRPLNRSAPDCRFMCQASSITFLATQGFDFNKLFKSGIPYLTVTEEEKLSKRLEEKQKIREDGLELIPVSDEDKPQIDEICSRIDDFLESEAEELAIDRCNGYIRRLIHQEVRQRWPGKIRLESKIDAGSQGLLVYKLGTKEEEEKKENNRREKEKMEMKEAVGLSALLRKIADSRKLIVGHNMLLDLCHIIHQFFGPLPESYSEFKHLLHDLFPKLIDTKILSTISELKDLIPSSILNHMLETVSSDPFSIPEVIPVEERSYKTNQEIYHEAGFDAYITGLCFIAMANYLGSQQSDKVDTVLPNSPVLHPFLNKLLIVRLKDFPYINLIGDDPHPNRNHVFHVTFPKNWKLSNISQLFNPYGGVYVSWLSDTTAYVGLNRREQAPNFTKKIKKNRHLGECQIQTYKSHQVSLNSIKNNDTEIPRKRKQLSTDSTALKNETPASVDADGWESALGKRRRKRGKGAVMGNSKEGEPDEKKPFVKNFMFCDENCVNMLRNILERQNERNRGINGAEGGASTPLRGSYSGPPRTRLTFKQSRLEPVPVYSLPPPVPKQIQALPKKFYFRSGQNNPGQSDRFIPVRRGQNFELAKYNLMKGDAESEIDAASNYLDIVSQINSLESIWRKRIMMSAFKRHDIILGAGNQKILNMGMKRMERYGELNEWRRGTRDSVVDEYQESIWKVKPRNRPLLGEHHQKIKIPNRSRVAYRGAIDWSSKDCIVAQVNYDLHFFTMTEAKKAHISISVESSYSGSRTIRCLKWNQAGDKIVMYSRSLTICVFDVPSSKVLWSEECVCDNCEIMCMSWSMNDDEIVVGCTEGKLCLFRSRGLARNRLIEQVQSHKGPLLTLAVSTNNRYLATTGIDKVVKIYLFPAMLLYLEIGYYDAPQAFAWHPWESGTLCIGGGQGDGSLSLWDMRRQESLGYKRVAFVGHVKNMKWNKISGELVVQWYYWEGDKRFVTVPVLASWDRVVDVAQWDSTRYGDNVANIIWNPDHTKIGIQVMNAILIWNFFAYQESEWRTKSNEEAKKKFTASISSCLNKCCIR